MSPLVSVIIPVYNGARFLREAIESVFAQQYEPIEVIVADDGSTDESAAIARSFSGVTVLDLPHGGVSAARNAAVAAADGEWLAFLDADDLWLPGRLRAQLEAAERMPGVDILLGHKRIRLEPGARGVDVLFGDGAEMVSYEPSVWLVRPHAFHVTGGFDVDLAIGEDTDWLVRAADRGIQTHVCPEVLFVRRIHDTNATSEPYDRKGLMLSILRDSVRRKNPAGGAGT